VAGQEKIMRAVVNALSECPEGFMAMRKKSEIFARPEILSGASIWSKVHVFTLRSNA